MSTATNTLAAVSLPADVWLTLVDCVAANDAHPGRFHDLAQLAWTCRDAYKAARRPLWQHLRLVFRIGQEFTFDVDEDESSPETVFEYQQMFQRHQQIMDSSVFPKCRSGQLDLDSERLERVRSVSAEYSGLQPFVVLDGKLYLASLIENERNPSDPDISGIASLWGAHFTGTVRIKGGLVLVPYPLHLVSSLTLDALASEGDVGLGDRERSSILPFLTSMDSKQIHALHCYSNTEDQYIQDLYLAACEHFTSITSHDYFLSGIGLFRLAIGPAARNVSMVRCNLDSEVELLAELGQLPHLDSFELLGSSDFDLSLCASPEPCLFTSPTLTRLVLDFDLVEFDENSRPKFDIQLPSLKEFTLTFQVAELLFPEAVHPLPPSLPSVVCFPSLTHLTLLDIERRHIAIDNPDISRLLPWIPYHHMPNLSRFHVPKNSRGANHYQSMDLAAVDALVSSTRVEHFIAPGLVGIVPTDMDEEYVVEPRPVVAHHLRHVHVAPRGLPDFMQFVAIPQGGVWSVHG